MGGAKRNPPYADVRWVPLRSTHPTFSAGFVNPAGAYQHTPSEDESGKAIE
ncbi:Uncharacterized protein dnm_025110 [Desulfonema magnum]|uniref:Uncharacterized protein n=1 Tax=Desulfonema magnum TaxID=45655 RepID=A0A975GN43_9BACT|nr:Uncharacterized protein dnm_025110 [Desulfonema magnum]